MKLSFRNRMLLTIVVSCVVCTATAIFVSAQKIEQNGKNALVEKSSAILSRLEVGAGYVAAMDTLNGVIDETVKKFPDGRISDQQKIKILKSVPIFAAFKIGEMGSEQENYRFRVASDKPRNKDNNATPDELAVIGKFRADPGLKEWVGITSDQQFVNVTRPVRISEARGCLSCHGDPSNSPWKNGKDILGYSMENMKGGDLRGTFTIVSSLTPVRQTVKASTRDISLWGVFITLISLLIGFLTIRKPISGINRIASGLSKAANEVASMSQEIAGASEQLSSGATEQAAALQETSASMEEVRSMVAKNSENAELSTTQADQSQNTAEHGKTVVEEMIRSIQQIDQSNTDIMTQIETSNRQISEIVKVISDIGNKTKVINDIVFQTKLLSFNASVEAARAGEHGKGFAVVAEEVGNLAQMSGNAAAEITQMLDMSIQKVEGIVNETKTKVEILVKVGKDKVQEGGLIAHRCADVLTEIVSSARSVSDRVKEISAGSQEQAKGVDEISKAVLQLDEVTQQNATAAQTSAKAADRMSQQADDLRGSVLALMQTLSGEKEGKVEEPEHLSKALPTPKAA